jgi:hypothetical protein
MSIGTSEADRSRAYIAATTESLHHSQQTLIPAVDSSPRLIAQVHFNGLKSLDSKYLVHFNGLSLLARGLNPWRVIATGARCQFQRALAFNPNF